MKSMCKQMHGKKNFKLNESIFPYLPSNFSIVAKFTTDPCVLVSHFFNPQVLCPHGTQKV